ncbi:MAG: hypothetical protein Q4F35_04500 [Akkermansia sp.]|nr:hypothetical protein [Akkermansia sp.]
MLNRERKWMLAVGGMLVAGGMAIALVVGLMVFGEHRYVDEESCAYSELSMDMQRQLMPGSNNIYRAAYHRSQTSLQYFRFDVPSRDMGEIERWLYSYCKVKDGVKRAAAGLPEGMSVAQPLVTPEWWKVPSGVHGVYYEFVSPVNHRKWVQAFVVPAQGRVWLKWSRL